VAVEGNMNILIELMTAVPLHGEMLECGNLRQFDVIEKQFPGTTYEISFKKSEESRPNQFSR